MLYIPFGQRKSGKKVDKSYEEQRRNNKCSHTRLSGLALTAEIIKTEPII